MMKKIRMEMPVVAIIISLLHTNNIFPQMQMEQTGNHAGPPGFVGKVVSIDEKLIVIRTESGNEEEVNVGLRTTFLRERSIKKSHLRKGDNLLIIGPPAQEDILRPIKIVVQKKRDTSFQSRRGGGGPTFGIVTKLNPLTVKLSSKKIKIVELERVRELTKQTQISSSEITKEAKVRIIAPPRPGTHGREAMIIILLAEDRESGKIGHSLLPDLPQQSSNPDFIYGIWLGRGVYSNEELDRAFRVANNLGIKYFKVEFKWDYVEPEKNKWQWNNENTIDVEHVIKLAKKYNLSIIPYFDTFMPWGEKKYLDPDKGGCEGPPSRRGQYQVPDPKEYAKYVFTVVDKLVSGGVDIAYIELDNEVSNLNDGYHSWNCFINVTAKQIKEIENSAYDKVKSKYPDIMVSSTTFSFPGVGFANPEKDIIRRNSFIKAYFGDKPKPKFDFLGLHETLRGSGNPYTTWNKPKNVEYAYNFGSYHNGYDMWRNILDRYGHSDKPIFNLESAVIFKGRQDVQLLQRAIFAKSDATKNKITGWVLSQLSGSKKFTEGRRKGITVGITKVNNGYELREGYYAFYILMRILTKYPNYEENIMGEINCLKPWIEKFSDNNGNILYVAFIPYHSLSDKPHLISLKVGKQKEAKITRPDTSSIKMIGNPEGNINLEVTQHPIFIEVKL